MTRSAATSMLFSMAQDGDPAKHYLTVAAPCSGHRPCTTHNHATWTVGRICTVHASGTPQACEWAAYHSH